MVEYKYIQRPKSVDDAIKILENDILPVVDRYWTARGEKFYDHQLAFNVVAFANLWVVNGLVLVIAYENGKAVGIFVGIKFTPMMFPVPVLQVETCYGDSSDIEQGLYNYVMSISNIISVDEIWVTTDTNSLPASDSWVRGRTSEIVRYSKAE